MRRLSKKTLVISIFLPALLFTLLSGGMAVRQLKRDISIIADILMSQVDHVTAIARHATLVTRDMAAQPCETVLDKMTATGALTPYIRSTGIVQDDILICSSVTGSTTKNVLAVYGTRIFAHTKDIRITTIAGTSAVPGQEAIIFALPAGNHMTAFSVVDARYLTDLMESLDDENHSVLKLLFSDGPVIMMPETTGLHGNFFKAKFSSAFSQAQLEIETPLLSLRHYFLRNMLFLGPLSVLLSLTVLFLIRRWQSRKMSLAEEIRKGITEGEFYVHYQPVCETTSGKCTGAEALMRWQREDGRAISPAVFISAAEENGMIISLTRHLFNLIAEDIQNWHVKAPFHLGVNIAAAHLADKTFVTDVLRLWVSLDPSITLLLEITERSLVEDTRTAANKLNELRQKGCHVAVDDFGTGYCSLNVLQHLPVDYLKIDKSFIDTLSFAGADTPVLDTIIGLSKRLGFATIAEGVSTAQQADWLTANGVPYVQGYFYARPLPAVDFYAWYSRQQDMS